MSDSHWRYTAKRFTFTPFFDGWAVCSLLVLVLPFFTFRTSLYIALALLVFFAVCKMTRWPVPMVIRYICRHLAGRKRPARTYKKTFS